ncbi:DUF167 domain-containing protein [Aquaspirillum serpens]|uniref:DUF167 domain-containing protein n=1 Tax=Aquaspirillum serpens TaxID=190 RepID=UPI0003B6810A|nr:DUF167 domain-containing protein [Aquaspirillum serpens]
MAFFTETEQGIRLTLHIQPGAKQTRIVGLYGEALKISLAAPPVDGKANQALLRFLAEELAIPMRSLCLSSGETSRRKVVIIQQPSATVLATISRWEQGA